MFLCHLSTSQSKTTVLLQEYQTLRETLHSKKHRLQEVAAQKCKFKIGKVTCRERRTNVTGICAVSNSVFYVTSAQEECPILSFPLAGESIHEQNSVPGYLFCTLRDSPQ